MEIKKEIGKVISVRKKAICSNCGTEMERKTIRTELREFNTGVAWEIGVRETEIYEYICPKCGAKEESDKLYPNVNFVPVFDDDEEKS